MVDYNKLLGMGRRRFLSTLAEMGVGAATLEHITQEAYAETGADPEEEVVYRSGYRYTGAGEREPTYERIPREEWNRKQGARDAMNRVQDDIAEWANPELVASGMEIIDTGQRSRTGIVVEYLEAYDSGENRKAPNVSYEKVKERLPDETHGHVGDTKVENIPVRLRKITSEPKATVYFDEKYRPVEDGVRIETPDPAFATLGPPFQQDSYGQGWATVGHNFSGTGTSHWCKQPPGGSSIGYCAKKNEDFNADVAYVTSTGPDYKDVLADDPDTTWGERDVWGTKSDTWISNHAGGSTNGHFQGTISGREFGNISRYQENLTGHVVRVTDAPQSGDSGSPMFHHDAGDDADYIIGVVAWNRDDDAAGNTADEFERQLNGYWLC